jgi:hypothetical protein
MQSKTWSWRGGNVGHIFFGLILTHSDEGSSGPIYWGKKLIVVLHIITEGVEYD